jgi:hypothetical protein
MKMIDAVVAFNRLATGDFSKGYLLGKGLPNNLDTFHMGVARKERVKVAEFLREIADALMGEDEPCSTS